MKVCEKRNFTKLDMHSIKIMVFADLQQFTSKIIFDESLEELSFTMKLVEL
jgi:hypothetical protein